MHRVAFIYLSSIAVTAVLAACGSSSKSQSSASAPPAASAAQPTSSTSTASAPASSAAPAALITTKHNKLGTILAYGTKRMTVYLFEADRGPVSSCTSACAKVWPPVIGEPRASGQAVASDLGTIKRADGSTQVTYKGHPLYLFVKDKDDGDTYGEGVHGFGAGWYVLAPSGNKVDNS